MERRERNPDTGEYIIQGEGNLFDVVKNVGRKLASKLTSKTAKKLATKATEKLIEKGSEKIGEKTEQLIGDKIYNKFSDKPTEETKGTEIINFQQQETQPSVSNDKYAYVRQIYNDLLL